MTELNKAKKLIRSALDSAGRSDVKITAKTNSFVDLARARKIFVEVWNFHRVSRAHVPSDVEIRNQDCYLEIDLRKISRENGFVVSFRNSPGGS